jgi:hypothetical protein
MSVRFNRIMSLAANEIGLHTAVMGPGLVVAALTSALLLGACGHDNSGSSSQAHAGQPGGSQTTVHYPQPRCMRGSTPGLCATVRAYMMLGENGDLRGAYAILSARCRADRSFEQFKRQVAWMPPVVCASRPTCHMTRLMDPSSTASPGLRSRTSRKRGSRSTGSGRTTAVNHSDTARPRTDSGMRVRSMAAWGRRPKQRVTHNVELRALEVSTLEHRVFRSWSTATRSPKRPRCPVFRPAPGLFVSNLIGCRE